MKKMLFACLFLFGCHSTTDFQDEIITNEIVVDFKDNVDEGYINELGNKLSIHFLPESDYSSVDKVYVGEYYGANEDDALDELNHNSQVEAADKNMIYTIPEHSLPVNSEGLRADSSDAPDTFPNDPEYKNQWHMRQVHLPSNWNDGPAGKNVIVAVIDTGSSQLSDFKNTNFMPGYNFVRNNKDARDDHGHGTHVAGTIAESTNNGIGGVGVAYRATIMPIKVLSAEGSGTTAAIVEGIRWATDHGAEVINMSLGGGGYSKAMANAVKYAHDNGVTVVCAAGNSATRRPSYPAAYPGAIAVAATQSDERVTFYSNWGPHVAISAPGGNTRGNEGKAGGVLQNTIDDHGKDDYLYFMGTSMASPHIAGVAALILSEGINNDKIWRKPDMVLKIMTETARDPSGMENDKPGDYAEHYGAGIVDASKAIQRVQSLSDGTKHNHKVLFYGLLILVFVVIILVKRKKK